METKHAKLIAAMNEGRFIDALRIAARFPRLGEHKAAITRAWSAHTHPAFYRELGENPEALVADGIAAIKKRYKID